VSASWRVERVTGSPGEIHALGLPDPVERLVRRCDATSPAIVLGSTQPAPEGGDPALPVVRRRSGGGGVHVEPGGLLWVDVALPAGDALWDDDVGLAFHWLGRAWVRALGDVGVHATAHEGTLCTTQWSRAVCFAGLGPGEVSRGDGRKVVGIAQRRSRAGALFQCAALLAWDPAPLVAGLGLPAPAVDDLVAVAAGLEGIEVDRLFEHFVAHLPV
jgi:lipoate-protein ligase A